MLAVPDEPAAVLEAAMAEKRKVRFGVAEQMSGE
jgi:hypothetical protein